MWMEVLVRSHTTAGAGSTILSALLINLQHFFDTSKFNISYFVAEKLPMSRLLFLRLTLSTVLALHSWLSLAKLSDACPVYFKNLAKLASADVVNETAVELEVSTYGLYLDLLDTVDGTLKPLFGEQFKPSDLADLDGSINFEKFNNKLPSHIQFNDLSRQEKVVFLKMAATRAKKEGQEFFNDRTFHGLKTKDFWTISSAQPIELFGVTYPAGTHSIDLRQVLRKVEHGNHYMSGDFIELHLRTKQRAGDLILDTWKFQDINKMPLTFMHSHQPARLPIELAKQNPEEFAERTAIFVASTNYLAEFITIMERNNGIGPANKKGTVTFFDNLSHENLGYLANDLNSYIRTDTPSKSLERSYRMAYVGYRGPGTYDDISLHGLEFRSISRESNDYVKIYENAANAIQAKFKNGQYELSIERWKKWKETVYPNLSYADRAKSTWYDQDINTLVNNIPPLLLASIPKQEITSWWQKFLIYIKLRTADDFNITNTLTKKVIKRNKTSQEIKMLLYDWSKHPLIFDQPELIQKILVAQKNAITKIATGSTEPNHEIVRRFLTNSGIYEHFIAAFK